MAVRRTRSQKEQAALRRMQLHVADENGNETMSYRLSPTAKAGHSPVALTGQGARMVAASPAKADNAFSMSSVFPYDIRLVYKDLLRTIVVTGIILAGLLAVWHFRVV